MNKGLTGVSIFLLTALSVGSVQAASPKMPKASVPNLSMIEDSMQDMSTQGENADFYSSDIAAMQKKSADEGRASLKASPGKPGAAVSVEDAQEVDIPPATKSDESGQQVFPEVTMRANVSSSDVNRLVCNGEIRDVVFSKEKGLKAQASGKNIFLKFYAKEDVTGKIKYAISPVEMFVVCGEHTYNVVLFPQKIPSQTIRLESGSASERIQKNTSIFTGVPFEKKINMLIKAGYTEEVPESFVVTKSLEEVKAFRDIRVHLTKTIRIEGEGLALKEYSLMPSIDLEVTEKTFMTDHFPKAVAAISVEHLRLKKGVKTRLFIIEKVQEVETGGGL